MTKEEALYKANHLRKVHPSICVDSEDFWETVIAALEQEPCDDCISRSSIKQKLQEHHDFFVNAYGGFSNLPQNDKSRVDEITNCIAMVVNEPPVTPAEKVGRWIMHIDDLFPAESTMECNKCHEHQPITIDDNYCPSCGAKMSEIPTSCSTCILDNTDACTRGAGRAVDDDACEDYLASPTGEEGSE